MDRRVIEHLLGINRAPYAWTITKDLIADPEAEPGTNSNAVGVVGPRTATLSHEEIKTHPERKRFRMKDDDGEVYYEGYWVDLSEGHDGEEPDGFEPLDDFGMPNAGCTLIQYWKSGKGGGWQTW